MLGHFGRGKSKHRPRNDPKLYNGEYPFIQTGDVRASAGRITGFSQTYNDVGLAQSKLWPAGTICITIAANIAETGILQLDACFPDSVVGLIPSKMVVGEYVEMFLRTAREDVERYAPATAQKNINLDILSDIAVPMPPLDEQLAIANLAASALSEIDALVRAIGDAEDRIIAVRQSILTAAFSGKLVPQNPGDEPASVLLDRLRAERAATGGARVRRQRSSGQVRSPAIGVEPPQPRCDP